MKKINLIFGVLFMVFLISLIQAGNYISSNPQYTPPGTTSYDYLKKQNINLYPNFGEEMCQPGVDFLVQVAPFGCTPSVVRSDLLEEQNVPVFCQLAATKVNPLIDVDAIDRITFSWEGKKPEGVAGIGFHPAKAALSSSRSTILNSPILENIGYLVVVLDQNKNESSMPDWVEGKLKATLKYDVQNAFGVGDAVRYLPKITDEDWEDKFKQYGFWNARGYLRAEEVYEDSARIGIYTDDDKRISSMTLKEGETSGIVYLPYLVCRAGVKIQLQGVESPATRAKIQVNGETVEVIEGEHFLDNRCRVVDIENKGLLESVKVSCKDDENNVETYELRISPEIKFEVSKSDEKKDLSSNVGDYLFSFKEAGSEKHAYLGYIGTGKETSSGGVENTLQEEDLFAYLYITNDKKDSLSDGEIVAVTQESERSWKDWLFFKKKNKYEVLNGKIERVDFWNELKDIKEFGDVKVKLEGFGDPVNLELDEDKYPGFEEFRKNFDKAIEDYRTVINEYEGETIPSSDTSYAEEAYLHAINLASSTGQYRTAGELCYGENEFLEKYPAYESLTYCPGKYRLANSESAAMSVYVNGDLKQISFEGVSEPSLEEFSLHLRIRGNGENFEPILRKEEIFNFGEEDADGKTEFVQLIDMTENSAKLRVRAKLDGDQEKYFEGVVNLVDGMPEGYKTNYIFSILDINLEKIAKVKIIPAINNQQSETNLSFKIGIEKRAIQLAPGEIEKKIDELNETITKWEKISNNLGTVVKGLKAACLTTGAVLTVKNFIQNVGGKAIARQEVMRGEGGWVDQCKDALDGNYKISPGGTELSGTYNSMDDCLLENSDAIDKDVDAVYNAIEGQEGGITEENLGAKTQEIRGDLDSNYQNPFNDKESIEVDEDLRNAISEEGVEEGSVTYSQLRDLERVNAIADNPSVSENVRKAAQAKRYQILENIKEDVDSQKNIITARRDLNQAGFEDIGVSSYANEKAINGIYSGGRITNSQILGGDLSGLEGENHDVEIVSYQGKKHVVFLEDTDNGYATKKSFLYEGVDSSGKIKLGEDTTDTMQKEFGTFEKYDRTSYKNQMKDPEVRYFETEPYKGMPAMVPFQPENGWYAATKQTIPAFGNSRSYDASGAPNSFYICNVGRNGRADFNNNVGDDVCRSFNPSNEQIYGTFPGLSQAETNKLVRDATSAMKEASRQYKKGIQNVKINGKNMKVGNPALNLPEIQCQDFMSPKDCNLLFNVCDPVICPSSRCNLGGAYHVDSVIQSGIVGSLALCLPNIQEGIYIPVCLTGVKAGIDGLLSIFQNYRDCLQTNLDTGQTVGICDEVYSIYLCEFFWRQAVPLAKMAIPAIIQSALGQGGQGGGEYLGVASAWTNAEESVDYMTNYYGAEAYNSFKLRTTDEAGSAVCKSFVSARYPASGEFFDALLEPDSPAQYHAWFNEIPYTTATVPATSMYKVFYHIFAGKDIGSNYQVYLKSPEGSSFYSSNPRVVVASGFIQKGSYASQTKEFTAPAGYKELCIQVNAKEECGFKEVSTSFAVDFLTDEIKKAEATKKDIKTERECISGTRDLIPSTPSLNLQEQVSDSISPDLRGQGIVRVCSTDNPGKGTDVNSGNEDSVWAEVGTCDSGEGKIKCWLDTRSLDEAFEFETTAKNAQKEVVDDAINKILSEGDYLTDADFEKEIQKLEKLEASEIVSELDGDSGETLLERLLLNSRKARIILLRADAYAEIAVSKYNEIVTVLLKTTLKSATKPIPPTGGEDVPEEKYSLKLVADGEFSEIYLDSVPLGIFIKGEELFIERDDMPQVIGSLGKKGIISKFNPLDRKRDFIFDKSAKVNSDRIDSGRFSDFDSSKQFELTMQLLELHEIDKDGNIVLKKEVNQQQIGEIISELNIDLENSVMEGRTYILSDLIEGENPVYQKISLDGEDTGVILLESGNLGFIQDGGGGPMDLGVRLFSLSQEGIDEVNDKLSSKAKETLEFFLNSEGYSFEDNRIYFNTDVPNDPIDEEHLPPAFSPIKEFYNTDNPLISEVGITFGKDEDFPTGVGTSTSPREGFRYLYLDFSGKSKTSFAVKSNFDNKLYYLKDRDHHTVADLEDGVIKTLYNNNLNLISQEELKLLEFLKEKKISLNFDS